VLFRIDEEMFMDPITLIMTALHSVGAGIAEVAAREATKKAYQVRYSDKF
jgi:hypothetical protein